MYFNHLKNVYFYDINYSEFSIKLNLVFILSISLFILGILGIGLSRHKTILFLMLCIEMILLSSVLNFIIFSVYRNDPSGQIYALFIITLAACESALGLGLLVTAYRVNKTVDFDYFENLRG